MALIWSLNLCPIFSSGRSLNEIILLPGFAAGMWGGPDRQLLCFWSTLVQQSSFPPSAVQKVAEALMWQMLQSSSYLNGKQLHQTFMEVIVANRWGMDDFSKLYEGSPFKYPPLDALLFWTSSCLSYYGSDGVTIVEATLMFYYRAAQQNPPIINSNKTNMCLIMIHLIHGIWSITTYFNNNNNNNNIVIWMCHVNIRLD